MTIIYVSFWRVETRPVAPRLPPAGLPLYAAGGREPYQTDVNT